MRKIQDIAWLAGLLEGEGCFRKQRNTPAISLDMTDRDVVERAAELLGVPGQAKQYRRRTPNRKPIWTVNVHGAHAAGWMMTLFTFLCSRRREKIEGILREWASHKGLMFSTKGMKRKALCHPNRRIHALGLCQPCYWKEKAKNPDWAEKQRTYRREWSRARTIARGGKIGYRKNNRYLEYNGERLTVTEWASRLGVRYGALFQRLNKGWSVEETLSRPMRGGKADGSSRSVPTGGG